VSKRGLLPDSGLPCVAAAYKTPDAQCPLNPHRPMFRAGYFQLIKYLAFCGLYFCILYVQMQVTETFKIDEVLLAIPCRARHGHRALCLLINLRLRLREFP